MWTKNKPLWQHKAIIGASWFHFLIPTAYGRNYRHRPRRFVALIEVRQSAHDLWEKYDRQYAELQPYLRMITGPDQTDTECPRKMTAEDGRLYERLSQALQRHKEEIWHLPVRYYGARFNHALTFEPIEDRNNRNWIFDVALRNGWNQWDDAEASRSFRTLPHPFTRYLVYDKLLHADTWVRERI